MEEAYTTYQQARRTKAHLKCDFCEYVCIYRSYKKHLIDNHLALLAINGVEDPERIIWEW